MRKVFFTALVIALIGHGLAFAQQPGANTVETAAPLIVLDEAVAAPRFRASAEYLFWWFKSGTVPPLVTIGGDGVLGTPGTQVLVGDLDFNNDVRQGGRFTLGYQFKGTGCGVEAGYFFLSDGQADVAFSSPGNPVLGRPFIDAGTGGPNVIRISTPGIAGGGVKVGAETTLWGAEVNLTTNQMEAGGFHLTAFAGFRFLSLADEVKIDDMFNFAGSTVGLQDDFRTVNRFYGGQMGLETGVRRGALTFDFRAKVALGAMDQFALINGETDVLAPNGATTIFRGAVLAQRSNIGRHQRTELAFVPEVGFNLGWQLTSAVKAYAGYSLLWVSNVARAGEQIDPVVNVRQIPIRFGNQPFPPPARPAFDFVGNDFWAQGMTFGMELRF